MAYRDVVVPGEHYRASLPASGRELSFNLPLGPNPPADPEAQAIIDVASHGTEGEAPAVAVNGVACALRRTDAQDNSNRVLSYSVPLGALPRHNNDTIAVTTAKTKPIKVLRVEARIAPSNGQ